MSSTNSTHPAYANQYSSGHHTPVYDAPHGLTSNKGISSSSAAKQGTNNRTMKQSPPADSPTTSSAFPSAFEMSSSSHRITPNSKKRPPPPSSAPLPYSTRQSGSDGEDDGGMNGLGDSLDDREDSLDPSGKKSRKRNRLALSCTECKRRKIKCDRKTPCEACCRRGEQSTCHWETPPAQTAPQPFALAEDHEALRHRVSILEHYIRQQGTDLSSIPSFASTSSSTSLGKVPHRSKIMKDEHHNDDHRRRADYGAVENLRQRPIARNDIFIAHNDLHQSSKRGGGENSTENYCKEGDDEDDDMLDPDSDTEDAALVLEELALGRKLTRVGPARTRKRKSSAVNTPTSIMTGSSVVGETPPTTTSATLRSPQIGLMSTQQQQQQQGAGSSHHFRKDATPVVVSTPTKAQSRLNRARESILVPAPEHNSRKRLVLDDVWRTAVPNSRPVMDWLINNYFTTVHWSWTLHHKPSFMDEYEAAKELLVQGRQLEIDPLWLAVFCMTLCLSVQTLENPVVSPLVMLSKEDLESMPANFFEAAQSSLECGDWTGKPRIRTLQAIVLFAPYLFFAGVPSKSERHQTLLGAAIRISQQLNLHRLGSDPTTMPPEDPALPSGINTLRREIPIRLLHVLLFLEYMNIRVKTSLPPHLVDCAMPGNFDDEDLSADSIVQPKPDTVTTHISLENVKFRIALLQRKFNEMVQTEAQFDYDTILELDKGYRSVIDTLPYELREDFIPPPSEPLNETWRRGMLTQTINMRLLRLHRPFMSRGIREARYSHSTRSALMAARRSLVAQQALTKAPLVKAGFQLLMLQGAVVVLFMNLWTRYSTDDDELQQDVALIREMVPFFEKSLPSRFPPVTKIAQQSLQVIDLLFDAVEKRDVIRHSAEGDVKSDPEEGESYGRLLKRIGAIVVSSSQSTDLTSSELRVPARLAARSADGDSKEAIFANGGGEVIHSRDPSINAPGGTSASYVDGGSGEISSGTSVNSALQSTSPAMNNVDTNIWSSNEGLYSNMNVPTFVPEEAIAFGSRQDLSMLGTDFIASLAGPEYADPNFDWTRWTAEGGFASLGSF